MSTSSNVIDIQSLSFRYYGTERYTLENVNLKIRSGDIAIIAGKSGSGKSTLLRTINGLIPHQHSGDYAGSVTVDGLEVRHSKMSQLAAKVGYIFQNPENQIFMFSAERDIAFGLENFALPNREIRKKVDWALNTLRIRNLALRAPHELSDGQKQRVAIAGSIVMGQKILILDEPTSLLDPFTARSLIVLIKELHDQFGITILVVEHRLDLIATIANRIIVLDEGRIAYDGEPREIMYSSNLLTYGVTEPTIVRTAKLLGLEKIILSSSRPISPDELAADLKEHRAGY